MTQITEPMAMSHVRNLQFHDVLCEVACIDRSALQSSRFAIINVGLRYNVRPYYAEYLKLCRWRVFSFQSILTQIFTLNLVIFISKL